jgi:hypothetical protein
MQIPSPFGKGKVCIMASTYELIDGLFIDGLTDVSSHATNGCFADATAENTNFPASSRMNTPSSLIKSSESKRQRFFQNEIVLRNKRKGT